MALKRPPINSRPWASRSMDGQLDSFLRAGRVSTPVSLIATSRDRLECHPIDQVSGIEDSPGLAGFDQIPLTRGMHIEAVFVRPNGVVTPLNETMLMSAHEPLVSFLETADAQRFRLLIDGSRIAGIVTLSDLQKLPVYSTLFSLIVGVELLLVEWIRRSSGGDDEVWLEHLTPKQRGSIEKYRRSAVAKNLEIERLAHASFGQEIRAAIGMGLFASDAELRSGLKGLEDLRHSVCHAAEFAATPADALKVPPQVRMLERLTGAIHHALPRMGRSKSR